MLPKGNAYDAEMIRTMELERIKPEDITRELGSAEKVKIIQIPPYRVQNIGA